LEQRYFDGPTAEVLRQLAAQRRETARQEERIVHLQQERGTIHQEQQRIRQNLESLGDRPAEKELRERFVRTLNSQEDRLEQIGQEIKEAEEARDRCRQQVEALLEKLEYDAAVS
jgi:chromosome segregation ATPase